VENKMRKTTETWLKNEMAEEKSINMKLEGFTPEEIQEVKVILGFSGYNKVLESPHSISWTKAGETPLEIEERHYNELQQASDIIDGIIKDNPMSLTLYSLIGIHSKIEEVLTENKYISIPLQAKLQKEGKR
jgi:hypothetical protein